MGDRTRSERSRKLEALFWAAFLAAVVPNTIEAFASPSASWWQPLRFALAALFTVALLALLGSRLADRRDH
jgi:hypothetical protein